MTWTDGTVSRLVDELQHMSEVSPGFLVYFDILPHALRTGDLHPRLVTLYEWYLQLKLDWLGLDPDADAELPGGTATARPAALGHHRRSRHPGVDRP